MTRIAARSARERTSEPTQGARSGQATRAKFTAAFGASWSFERGPATDRSPRQPQCPDRPQLRDLEMAIGRFRFVVIAIAVLIIAGSQFSALRSG